MEMIEVGFLSILPPIIAIGLALITKEVLSSLLIGILSGGLIYATQTGMNAFGAVEVTFSLMGSKIGDNANILLFLALLGSLVVVTSKAGGSAAYGRWASSKIKTKSGALLSTYILGALIFIDDYFNCLTVGTVMKPVTDKHNISREKLAYVIDATAAPICIIAPVSSWAAAIISQIEAAEVADPMGVFVASIPYNLYAILTLIMVCVICLSNLDFGPMTKFNTLQQVDADKENSEEVNLKGKVRDLIIPIVALIVFSVVAMLYVGGYTIGGDMSIAEGFGNTDASVSLVYGGFGALVVSFILYIPRKIMTFHQFMECIVEGIKSMAAAFSILIMAWTISGVCRDLLGTGEYVGELVKSSNIPVFIIPAIVFAVAAFLSFSMGTAWGTFTILIPIVAIICSESAPELLVMTLSATLAGSVFGDHCSPISDTTILASTGAGCNHINHVSTQIPYAVVVAVCSFIGYIVAGLTYNMGIMTNILITLAVSIGLLIVTLKVLHKKFA